MTWTRQSVNDLIASEFWIWIPPTKTVCVSRRTKYCHDIIMKIICKTICFANRGGVPTKLKDRLY